MPILDKPLIVLGSIAYLILVCVIGVWALRRTRNSRDYFIAGRKIGLFVTGLGMMAASYSGFVFIGGPGMTYRIGFSSFFICSSLGFTAAMLCWTVGKRLRLLAEVREVYTVPDALLCRFKSRQVSGLAAVAILVGTIGYLGAQFLALGRLVEAVFGTREHLGEWSLLVAIGLGMAVVLAYSVGGGMVAGVYTDFVQGALMVVAAVAVFVYAIDSAGGIGNMLLSIGHSDRFGEAFLDPLGGAPVYTALGFFFVFSVGVLGQPHMLHKFYMLDDPRKLKWMPLMIGGSQSLCVLIWLGIGLAVPALVAQGRMAPLERPDDASLTFLLGFAPDILTGVVVAGILAAIMSTADSFANIGSAALVRDIPKALGWPVDEGLTWARRAVLAVSLASGAAGYLYGDLVALLGVFAFGTFGAALTPVMVVGLSWRRVPSAAAAASILTGVVVNLSLEFMRRQTLLPEIPFAPGVMPSAVALTCSFLVLFAVTYWREPRTDIDPDVAAILDA